MGRLKLETFRLYFQSFRMPVTRLRLALLLLMVSVLFCASACSPLQAQAVFRIGVGFEELANDVGGDDENMPGVASSGVLKTDPDLESILQQAERIKEDGNYRVASQLWQAVLQRSGDSLYSSDGVTYFSLVQQVEATLANLPSEGLAAYRVLADAEVKELLAQAKGPNDDETLSKILQFYFVSSFGDEAAYSLGCIYLDRHDFVGAIRLFEKVATQHPDPSMPMDELYSRIALCQAFLGDVKLAEVSLQKATETNVNSEASEMVRRSLARLVASQADRSYLTNWVNPMGDARRYGTMPPLPNDVMSQDLAAVWQFYFDPQEVYKFAADVDGQVLTGKDASGVEVRGTVDDMEEELITSWRKKGWRPAGHLLLDSDRVYFKTGSDVSVWNRDKVSKLVNGQQSGEKQIDVADAVQWRSVWHNVFRFDDATEVQEMLRKHVSRAKSGSVNTGSTSSATPTGLTEIQFFGDQIYQQMSIYKGNLYAIEGKSFGSRHKKIAKGSLQLWGESGRQTRARTNFLTAYDSVSGQVQWTLPRESAEEDAEVVVEGSDSPWIFNGGFMSAPIGYGDTVLVPVNSGGSISIYALDPNQEGKTIWKSFLCDEPESGAAPWSAINLSIEGSDLFVSCGMGVVFVLDPASGVIRFAKRYERRAKQRGAKTRNSWTPNRLEFEGWSSDMVVPYHRQMICFNSDSESIVAYDRNTGKTIWRTEITPIGFKVDYILGVYNDMLYAAGSDTVVAYDLAGEGRMVWGAGQVFDGKQSLGRGMLTPNGVFMPVEDTIYQFDLNGDRGDAKVIAKVHVDLGTRAPVGNLYSDGERFWVHGANRLYALGPAGQADPKSLKGSDRGASKTLLKNSDPKTACVNQSDAEKIDSHLEERGIVAAKTASGLRYVIDKKGKGPLVPKDATVSVHYHGTLLDGTVFDSSVDRGGEPLAFRLEQVIPGWAEGVKLLNKGAKATLYIPSKLAYGDCEMGKIKANSVLKFEIEVLDF